jgi:hypothetical protein
MSAKGSTSGRPYTGSMLPLSSGLLSKRALRESDYHAVAEEGIPFREIATVIGRRLNVPVVSKMPEEAKTHFGWFAQFAAIDTRASSQWTREHLGWQSKQPGLISDIDRPRYFGS